MSKITRACKNIFNYHRSDSAVFSDESMMSNASSDLHKEQKLGEFTMDLYDDEALIKELEREQKRRERLEAKRLIKEESLRDRKKKANASSDIHKEQKLGEFTMDLYDDEALIKKLEREQKKQECLEVKTLTEEESVRERKEEVNGSSDTYKEQKLGEFTTDLYENQALIKELEREQKRQERLEAKRLAEEESLRERKEKALKGMKYLLGLSEQYTTFFHQKVFSNTVK